MTDRSERCAKLGCGLPESDLLHAVPGTEAYAGLNENRRRILFYEIGGVHAFVPPASPQSAAQSRIKSAISDARHNRRVILDAIAGTQPVEPAQGSEPAAYNNCNGRQCGNMPYILKLEADREPTTPQPAQERVDGPYAYRSASGDIIAPDKPAEPRDTEESEFEIIASTTAAILMWIDPPEALGAITDLRTLCNRLNSEDAQVAIGALVKSAIERAAKEAK